MLTLGAGASVAASAPAAAAQPKPAPAGDRAIWVGHLQKLADPVLTHLVAETLKLRMPVEQAAGAKRQGVTHLEALGRLIAGMAPWLELAADGGDEGRLRARYADLARGAIDRAVDPASKDFLNFTRERQPLVDAAFLAQGVLRAPRALRDQLPAGTRRHLVAALESSRVTLPGFNNWLLFSATVESRARQARRDLGPDARRLRAAAARSVVSR